MATDPITGVNGAIDGQKCIQQFTIQTYAEIASFLCASTDGAVGNESGITDWLGLYQAYGHTPRRMPGDLWTFTGASRDGQGYTGSAYTERAEIEFHVAGGLPLIYHKVNFAQGQGALSRGAYTATDSGSPNPPSPIGLTMTLDGDAQGDMQYMKLILECKSAGDRPKGGYVTSSTGGIVYRKAGNKKAYLVGRCLFGSPSDLPVENGIYAVHVNVDSTPTYWDMNWFRFSNVTTKMIIEDMGEHRAKMWECSFQAEWGGWKDTVKGHIINPALTYWWGD